MSRKEDSSEKPKHGGRNFPRRFVTLRQQIDSEKHTKSESYGPDQEDKRTWEKASIIVSAIAAFVIALATIATVWVTIHHAKIFSGQLEAMRGQLDEMRIQSAITKSQLRANPNVTLEAADIRGPNNEFLGAYITPQWKNVGGTEAVAFSGWARGHFFTPDIPLNFDFSRPEVEGDPPGAAIVPTSVPVSIPQNGLFLQASAQFRADDIRKALAENGIFYLWINVQYRDIFPDTAPHHVTICVRVIPRMMGDRPVFAYPLYKPECNRRD